MTPRQRQQLEYLLQEQQRLALAVIEFDERLRDFAEEVEKTVEPEPAPVVAPPKEPAPLHVPPPLPSPATAPVPLGPPDERGYRAPPAETAAAPVPLPAPEFGEPLRVAKPLPVSVKPLPPAPASPPAERGSLEMTLGTVWLARIGIVILVTGLVFLGNFAYQHIVHRLGPGGKVAMLYGAAGILAGLGVWLEKRPVSSGRFPQVLMAGGAATAYYTTYGAHFVDRLRIIQSPLVGGVLLLLVAGIFVSWADRRKFQTAALLGILLSYYTAAINELGDFTLYSSVLLTVAAGFLLVRNGWAMASWLSLAGTYGSYVYWILIRTGTLTAAYSGQGDPHEWERLMRQVWEGNFGMLAAYWALFTGSVFLARKGAFLSIPRTSFLTLNNALFFLLATLSVRAFHADRQWMFTLGFGCILLALTALARYRHVEDLALDGSYLVQGLAAVTAGLALKFTGAEHATALAIILVVESAVLLSAVTRRHGAIYRIGAVTTAVWAFCLAFDRMSQPELMIPLGGTVGALLIFDAWWLKQRSGWLPAMLWSLRAAGFAALGMFLIGLIITQRVDFIWEPAALAVAALVATASVYLLRLPEVVLLGQLYLVAAVGIWLQHHYPGHPMREPWTPWWQPLPVIFTALGLAHWWQRQRIMRGISTDALHIACAAGVVAIGYFWSRLWLVDQSLAVVLTCAGVATMAYGYFTRAWAISLLGQVFAAAAIFEVFHHFGPGHFPWFIGLLPIFGVVAAAAVLARGRAEHWPAELRPALQPAVAFYWVITFALTVGWVLEYIPTRWQLLMFSALGAVLFLTGARWPSRPRTYTGFAFGGIMYFFVLVTHFDVPGWPDLLAVLLLPAAMRVAHRLAPATKLPGSWPEVLVGLTTASVWLWVTRWIYHNHHVEMLTVAWSGLAVVVFVAGLSLRDRIYRIGGFLILALAVGRIFLVDVWKLETVYRILSFMVLGIVLLALGFVYNRYADKIRRWL
ncbi:MAG TPA: DUF2339 domain-containing protein [Chthoniobacteraceae bacterium]|jgi:hypothetical protein|nr:DUF2339 domain-containing protein [Chthoniobacteraceae bacterium]